MWDGGPRSNPPLIRWLKNDEVFEKPLLPQAMVLPHHLPDALRKDLEPALQSLMEHGQHEGLWMFGS